MTRVALLVLAASFALSSVHVAPPSFGANPWSPDASPRRLVEIFGEGLFVLEGRSEVWILEFVEDTGTAVHPDLVSYDHRVVRRVRLSTAEARRVVRLLSEHVGAPTNPDAYRSWFHPTRALRFVRGAWAVDVLDNLGANDVSVFVTRDPEGVGWGLVDEFSHHYAGSLGPHYAQAARDFAAVYARAGLPLPRREVATR